MKNHNIGIINLVISNTATNSFLNETTINESLKITSEFINIVKKSPLLQLEFKVFNNIENSHIEGEVAANKYLDNNIKLFEIYTITEIDVEREKIGKFVNSENIPTNKRTALYEAIDTLITETLSDYNDVDVNKIHEATTLILEHLKTSKVNFLDVSDDTGINEDVVKIAVNLFNKKYSSLNEDDISLIKALMSGSAVNKEELLGIYKKDTLILLEEVNGKDVTDNITKAISKINEMEYNDSSVDDNIISLYELKKDLI